MLVIFYAIYRTLTNAVKITAVRDELIRRFKGLKTVIQITGEKILETASKKILIR